MDWLLTILGLYLRNLIIAYFRLVLISNKHVLSPPWFIIKIILIFSNSFSFNRISISIILWKFFIFAHSHRFFIWFSIFFDYFVEMLLELTFIRKIGKNGWTNFYFCEWWCSFGFPLQLLLILEFGLVY